jgi:hypothetical protein
MLRLSLLAYPDRKPFIQGYRLKRSTYYRFYTCYITHLAISTYNDVD